MPTLVFPFLVALLLTITSCNDTKFVKSTAVPKPTPGPTPTPQGTRDVNYSAVVQVPNNRLDILLIVDDSNSMLADNQKLAARMADFVSTLQNWQIDWQMCVTVTRALTINNNPAWGASVIWSNYTPAADTPAWVLRPNANISTIFANTINNIGAGWVGTDDERGLKAAYWHVYNGDVRYANHSKCYRADAALAMIIVSDEDVRSVGGDAARQYYANEYKPLENDDLPATLQKQVRDVFGMNKRFTFNSIIVKPNDTACQQSQDAGGAKSHFGLKYNEMSTLTGGGIGSICDVNYSTNLNLFANSIQSSLSSVPLECMPVNGAMEVVVSPVVNGLTTSLQGANLIFTPGLPAGRNLSLKYKCYVN
ncbi:MAG: hypothetical protein ACK5Y2_09815 [Bdellovibrionales bacterium]